MDFEKLYNRALRFLTYRHRSEKEVRGYLINKIARKKALTIRHSGEEGRRLQNLLTTQKNGRDSGHGQNDEIESIIEKIVAKLREQKFIDDGEFVRWWIEQRTQFKPRSLRLIKIELKQKGVADDLIESGIRNQRSGTKNDLEQAKKLIEKRIERFRNLTKQEIYQKLGSFLARRGFDWDTIKQSIDEVITEGV